MEINKAEIDRFRHLATEIVRRIGGEKVAPDAYLLGSKSEICESKKYPYVVSAIVHGNEVGGIASLNDFLEMYATGLIVRDIPVVVFLGNVKASELNKRFVERDMNRSFNLNNDVTHEARRTQELDEILSNCHYYLDIHQTKKRSQCPFFIFPFQKTSFEFARSILPRTNIVCHWGQSFSAEGMCSDEYVNKKGGVGITLELGQNGFDPYHISIGLQGILSGYNYVRNKLFSGISTSYFKSRIAAKGEIYTWAEIVTYPQEGLVELDEGWDNFDKIEAGQRMGSMNSEEMIAPRSGYMIFPNYTKINSSMQCRPKELYRIMKKISESQLPEKVDCLA